VELVIVGCAELIMTVWYIEKPETREQILSSKLTLVTHNKAPGKLPGALLNRMMNIPKLFLH
jgi:hypothetical protein